MAVKRRALITGASAGLGVEFARQLAERGVDLLLVARRADKLEAVAEAMRKAHGIDVQIFADDLSQREAPARIEAHVRAQSMTIDWLVNNAGASGPDLLEDRDWNENAAFLELMMISVAQMCHRFVPPMQERGFGRVINVSSFAGRLPTAAGANYGPAKAWVVALSEELALECRGSGVHVCALCPGFTHTDFHETAGLMDMKNGLPDFMWYDADVVARDGLRACERGKAICVSGRFYRFLDPIAQSVLTRGLLKAAAPRR